ncbi:Calcium-activated potassium channel subunit alpha-1 [Phytophthora cinnamomi]|uniref:Calcium-activated potassium channel subunit alpha-1 n=1 Tax=Phytophthora cinnamomi TaxID=4785 RepID=UPI0035594E87|nr:Calcium-activated potassium channel subunit alpha-1 [Phytophthora cinnamomi]
MPAPPPAPVAADAAPKRPVLTTRRSSQRGVAMSHEKRPPRELLKRIGISGKEVVKIIRQRGWSIEEPHGLQQQKLYYVAGAKDRETEAQLKQRRDFFVGEGELYAFILKQGGLRYLLPDEDFSSESDESDVEPTQPSKPSQEDATTVGSTNAAAAVERNSAGESDALGDSSDSADEAADAGSEQRRWKRRKKLSTARSKSTEKATTDKSAPATVDKTLPPRRRRKAGKKRDCAADDEQDRIRVSPRVKLEQATYVGVGQQAEFTEYMSSLTARGWRAQLLQDVDVHLLRSVAAVDRRQRAMETAVDGQKKSGRPTEGVGPHVQDAAEVFQELEGLMYSIRASQDDLSTMLEAVIVEAERSTIPDRIDPVGRIGIPGFVSTGLGNLELMRDIERYLLLFVAAVRRYQRTRRAVSANEPSTSPSTKAVKRADLRALQLRIEESKTELQELAEIVSVEVKEQTCQEPGEPAPQEAVTPQTPPQQPPFPTPSQPTSQTTCQSTSQSTAKPTDGEADVDTDHDQSSSQQSVASSPQRLEGGVSAACMNGWWQAHFNFGPLQLRSGDA